MAQMNVRAETMKHMLRVNELCQMAAWEISRRGVVHDRSKLESPEVELFDEYTEQLAALTYDSPEYHEMRAKLKPALDHHYANNSHHAEHYPKGIDDFDLFDMLECLLDWKAAGERQNDGNILVSLEKNKKRFKLSPQLYNILKNTVERYLR